MQRERWEMQKGERNRRKVYKRIRRGKDRHKEKNSEDTRTYTHTRVGSG
jgi:hypothetical protein